MWNRPRLPDLRYHGYGTDNTCGLRKCNIYFTKWINISFRVVANAAISVRVPLIILVFLVKFREEPKIFTPGKMALKFFSILGKTLKHTYKGCT